MLISGGHATSDEIADICNRRFYPPLRLPLVIQLETPIGASVVDVGDDGVRTRVGEDASPDITIRGAPWTMLELLSGRTSLSEARGEGVSVEGDEAALAGFPAIVAG